MRTGGEVFLGLRMSRKSPTLDDGKATTCDGSERADKSIQCEGVDHVSPLAAEQNTQRLLNSEHILSDRGQGLVICHLGAAGNTKHQDDLPAALEKAVVDFLEPGSTDERSIYML